jgi:hypothetical protein
MTNEATFPLRYGTLRPLLSAMGLGPAFSRVSVDADRVRVRMGWGFRADMARGSIVDAAIDNDPVGGIGVHGWRGRWLVNGAAAGLVRLQIDPPVRAFASGVPVRLRQLRVSVEDPDGLLAALGR